MLHLFIADDERMVVERLTEDIDWTKANVRICGTALTSEEALRDIKALKPDVLLADIEMPLMNGLELIAQARRDNPRLRCIVLSGYDKFDYAQTAMKSGACAYLLKPVNEGELLELMAKINEEVEAERTLSNRQLHLEQIAAATSSRQLSEKLKNALVWKSDLQELQESFPVLMRPPFALWAMPAGPSDDRTVCSTVLEERELKTGIFEYMGIRFAVFFNQSPSLNACKWGCGRPWLLASEGISSLKELTKVYDRMVGCLWNGFYLTQGHLTPLPSEGSAPEMPDASKMADAVLGHDWEAASHMLTAYLTAYARLMKNPDRLFIHTAELLGSVSKLLSEKNLSLKPLRISELCAAFQECSHFSAFSDMAQKRLHQLYQAFDTANGIEMDVIAQAKQYVMENYDQPLSLTDLAQRFYLNPSYFSYLFYKRSGVKLHDFIRTVRLQKACELLLNTNLTVAEISNRVGYDNYRRFCTLFRENYGITAQNWRRTHGSKAVEK